jgi:hypothetical protein
MLRFQIKSSVKTKRDKITRDKSRVSPANTENVTSMKNRANGGIHSGRVASTC